jgi:uncharacterized lipoprotein YajG
MKTKILFIILISLFLIGCSAPEQRAVKVSAPQTVTKLVEVQQPDMTLTIGNPGRNILIINNVKEQAEMFNIIPCSGCQFDVKQIEVAAKDSMQVLFMVSPEAGQKDIKVKDRLNNIYGTASFNVKVQ